MREYALASVPQATVIVVLLLLLGNPVESHGEVRTPPASIGQDASDDPSGEILTFWRELRDWSPQEGRVAAVSNLVLTRDAAEFRLDDGALTLLDLHGRTVAAVFEGSGRVRIEPPLEVERRQLLRHLDSTTPEVAIEKLFILFADSTARELETSVAFATSAIERSTRNAVRDGIEALVGGDEMDMPPRLVSTFLNEDPTDLFWAHIVPRRGRDLYFAFDASAEEEVEFGRKASRGNAFEVLTSFYRREAYDGEGRLVAPRRRVNAVDAMQYVAELSIDGLDHLSARSEVMLIPNRSGGGWVAATLFHDLAVDSLRWGDGSAVLFDRSGDDVSWLWLRLPDDAEEGLPLKLIAWYGGKLLDRTEGFYHLRTTSGWLPRFGASEATYDLTFRSKADWPVMSVGTRVSREVDPDDEDIIVTRWITKRPSSRVTFSVGDFEAYEFPEGRTAPIRIHIAEEFHARMLDLASRAADATRGRVMMLSQRDPEQKVHLDIENSLAFFSEAFGALDFQEYNVAEIPGSHGEAFPGMINLSWITFQWTTQEGWDELFRAHEVAHQWWGIAVRPRTYHDVWLSEGLSEFSALWYLHRVRANPQRYLDRLEDLKEGILDRKGDTGPIWLGSRLAVGREGDEDYTVGVYSKGAWIFHMLRNLMLDHDTGSEDLFEGFMQALFERFHNRTITTAEFRRFLEVYLETDMQWFFDQWVHGTEIPTYRFAYTTEEQAGGDVMMRVRIRQEDVPDDFMMIVPIQIDFGDEGTAVVPVLVRGREVETDLPLLPRVPDSVTFNVLESVLAVVHTEKW